MNKSMKMILIVTILTAFISCEQTVDYELPYQPKIVVKGILTAGEEFSIIEIYKTLPPLTNFSYDEARVTDALVEITDDSGNKYKGSYQSDVSYKLDIPIHPKPGNKFRITVSWNGLNCSAETIVPDSVELGDIRLANNPDDVDFKSVEIAVKKNNYDCLYQAYYTDYGYFYEFDTKTNRDTTASGNLYLTFTNIYFPYQDTTDWKNSLYYDSVTVMTYDIQYLNYNLTRNAGYLDNDPFSNTGKNVKWNISGDGIGLFIGRTRSVKNLK